MSRSTSSALRVTLVVCVILSAVMAHAQYRTSIQGVVTDTTGAVISGANLTLTNPATGEKTGLGQQRCRYLQLQCAAAAPFTESPWKRTASRKKCIDNLQLIPEQANAVTFSLRWSHFTDRHVFPDNPSDGHRDRYGQRHHYQ